MSNHNSYIWPKIGCKTVNSSCGYISQWEYTSWFSQVYAYVSRVVEHWGYGISGLRIRCNLLIFYIHAENPGPCITNVFATRRKNFSQWHRSFQRKLRSHWLKFLRHGLQWSAFRYQPPIIAQYRSLTFCYCNWNIPGHSVNIITTDGLRHQGPWY